MNTSRDQMKELAITTMIMAQEIKDLQSRGIDQTTIVIFDYCTTHETVRASDIAAALDVNPSSITRRIQALEREGIIKLTRDSADQRSVLISITDEGREMADAMSERATDLFVKIAGHWNEDDIRSLTELISKFSFDIKKWKVEYPVTNKNALRKKISQSWKSQP